MIMQALIQSVHDGVAVTEEIHATAERLRELMMLAHGGKWSIDISHEACFVAVCRDFPDEPEVKPC